jgi:hypothetical protein
LKLHQKLKGLAASAQKDCFTFQHPMISLGLVDCGGFVPVGFAVVPGALVLGMFSA